MCFCLSLTLLTLPLCVCVCVCVQGVSGTKEVAEGRRKKEKGNEEKRRN